MKVCGQEFNSNTIHRIQTTVEEEPTISRRELSRRVCTWLDWKSPNGNYKVMSCRKALLTLHRKGLLQLRECDSRYAFQHRNGQHFDELPLIPQVSCGLSELGDVKIVPVTSRYSKSSRIWNALMDTYHYLGKGPLCGAQIRYLIWSETVGWLGALSFSGASWCLKSRDGWIGWSEAARRANLQKVVCNSRFLILPTVRVPNLASHTLSLAIKRLARDWIERYGYEPVLVETFVDPARFTGTSYRAANWIFVGKTSGRRELKKDGKRVNRPKDIYVYPLRSDWQSILCREPVLPIGSTPRPENPADWVEEEFGSVTFYDERLKHRLYILTRDFFAQPGALVPQACNGSVARTKGAYRFFENQRVDMQTLLKPHIESTLERIKGHQVVLAVQDTTILNYTAHPTTEGLGPINNESDNAVGLILHDTMAFTEDGTPLGLLDVQCWARDPEEAGKRERRHELPIEDKESLKWLKSYRAVNEVQKLCSDTILVSVGDREADIYELFYEATQGNDGAQLLVRAERTRNRKVEQTHLWEKMAGEVVKGIQEVSIPRKGSRPARMAKLEIRFAPVRLEPPKRKKHLTAVEIWAVYARETDYSSEVKSPLEWMLLTTVEVSTFKDALERLKWYALRWGIEVYHRTLKSGCRIEDRRLNNAYRLESCLAIDMVVAWRVYFLTKQGRETPDIPCDVFLKEEEWKVLYSFVNNTYSLPEEPPTLRQAVRMIASLGGFLGRKSDGEPGTTTLWRGLQRLDDMVLGYKVHPAMAGQRSGP